MGDHDADGTNTRAASDTGDGTGRRRRQPGVSGRALRAARVGQYAAVAAAVAAVLVVAAGPLWLPDGDDGADERAPAGDDGAAGDGDETHASDWVDGQALGSPNAPVLIVEHGDFACPYCARHANEVKPRIVEDYVDAGVVRYQWRDLPVTGPGSVVAAAAGRVAAEHDAFWEWHAQLFDPDEAVDVAGMAVEDAAAAAERVGVDAAEVAARADVDGELAGDVLADAEDLTSRGIAATPTFLVAGPDGDGVLIEGAQPYEAFVDAIDAALDRADADDEAPAQR